MNFKKRINSLKAIERHLMDFYNKDSDNLATLYLELAKEEELMSFVRDIIVGDRNIRALINLLSIRPDYLQIFKHYSDSIDWQISIKNPYEPEMNELTIDIMDPGGTGMNLGLKFREL